MQQEFDVIIIGAGPSGIFCAYELLRTQPSLRVLIIERGHAIEHRTCPKRITGVCAHCNPCSITSGFAGAGAFSDGKLSLSPEVGGYLPDFLGPEQTRRLIRESDEIYLAFGADTHVYGIDDPQAIAAIRAKARRAGLSLVECPIRHLGTEEGGKLYQRMQNHLISVGVTFAFDTAVADIIIENGKAVGVVTGSGERYSAPSVVAAVGRVGSAWLSGICRQHGIDTEVGTVDIGVRVELSNDTVSILNDELYEAKLKYVTPTYRDKVRTFCTNPGGEVTSEVYDGDLMTVNGHAYKSTDRKTANTNFALLVSQRFTKPFKTPISYGRSIARLANMLCDGSVMVQTLGDIRRGRRSTEARIAANPIQPTMKDAVAGDLALALPHRIMVDLMEMIDALDKLAPGVAADETLLYGIEVKFYSNMVTVTPEFETNVKGLYAIGDGASITHGLQQASANGLAVARAILSGHRSTR
ncbi:MAG: NAD(P)/FAD-dependent oxidoreductase [Eggerthellaceae bacterium]|jgi:uncharacterized FAD-dependent dehydrogenase